jgi:hypothetical protein
MAVDLISTPLKVFIASLQRLLEANGRGKHAEFIGKRCNGLEGKGQSNPPGLRPWNFVRGSDCPFPQFLTEVGLAAEPHIKCD